MLQIAQYGSNRNMGTKMQFLTETSLYLRWTLTENHLTSTECDASNHDKSRLPVFFQENKHRLQITYLSQSQDLKEVNHESSWNFGIRTIKNRVQQTNFWGQKVKIKIVHRALTTVNNAAGTVHRSDITMVLFNLLRKPSSSHGKQKLQYFFTGNITVDRLTNHIHHLHRTTNNSVYTHIGLFIVSTSTDNIMSTTCLTWKQF